MKGYTTGYYSGLKRSSIDEINEILADKLLTVTTIEGLEKESEQVTIRTKEGCTIEFYHLQDCCEYVRLVDFENYITKLESAVILGIEESTSNDEEGYADHSRYNECHTWTFYTIKTSKGDVWMRWLGESNGYYSEDVKIDIIEG